MVVDTFGNRGNGTSNSALQWAQELERQGHRVSLVGVNAPEYPAKINRVPLVSWVAAKQQMQFAQPSATLFDRAFDGVDLVSWVAAKQQMQFAQPSATLFDRAFDGVDIVHIYTPFKFGRHALAAARAKGLPVTAGYHVQPENVTYSAGPLKYVPGADSFIYWLFKHWLYRNVDAIHVPTELALAVPQRRRDPCADGIGGPVVARAPLHGADPCDFKRLPSAVRAQAAASGRRSGGCAVQDRGVRPPVERKEPCGAHRGDRPQRALPSAVRAQAAASGRRSGGCAVQDRGVRPPVERKEPCGAHRGDRPQRARRRHPSDNRRPRADQTQTRTARPQDTRAPRVHRPMWSSSRRSPAARTPKTSI